TDQQIRLLARYALTVLLPDPDSASEWARIKSVLVDFGYHLTDRGIRRGRDPIDAILATTVAKDRGAPAGTGENGAGARRRRLRFCCARTPAGHASGRTRRRTCGCASLPRDPRSGPGDRGHAARARDGAAPAGAERCQRG